MLACEANARTSDGVSLLHPCGWAVVLTGVPQPCRCHLAWPGFPRLGASALPITLPIGITAHSLHGTSPHSPHDSPQRTLQGMRLAAFSSYSPCYHGSLAKKAGKCNLSEEPNLPQASAQ